MKVTRNRKLNWNCRGSRRTFLILLSFEEWRGSIENRDRQRGLKATVTFIEAKVLFLFKPGVDVEKRDCWKNAKWVYVLARRRIPSNSTRDRGNVVPRLLWSRFVTPAKSMSYPTCFVFISLLLFLCIFLYKREINFNRSRSKKSLQTSKRLDASNRAGLNGLFIYFVLRLWNFIVHIYCDPLTMFLNATERAYLLLEENFAVIRDETVGREDA